MKRYAMWSGGKDSSASIIICHQIGIHLDGVVMAEVMFDHKRGISGENPKHIEWVYKTAIPIIESLGYKVIVLRDHSDYVNEFNRVVTKRGKAERNGKKAGFFIGGMCSGNSRLKMRPIRSFLKAEKAQGEIEEIVGIAYDEPKRLARLKIGKRSVLKEQKITEAMAYDICKKYGLLSPIYGDTNRGGVLVLPQPNNKGICTIKTQLSYALERIANFSPRAKHSKQRI